MKSTDLKETNNNAVRNIDKKTREFANNVFQAIARGCKYRVEDLLEFDFEDDYGIEVEIENLDTEQYLERLESVFGYTNPEKMYTHYHTYPEDDTQHILFHMHEVTFGTTKWMSDFNTFSRMVNTILGAYADCASQKCIFRDTDFAKEQFEMVQDMVKQNKAA